MDALAAIAYANGLKKRAETIDVDGIEVTGPKPPLSRPLAVIGKRLAAPVLQSFSIPREKALSTPQLDDKDVIAVIRYMAKRYPELRGVAIRLGEQSYLHSIKRILQNEKLPIVQRLIGVPLIFPRVAFGNLGATPSYTFADNTVTLYSNVPEALAHELGHAVMVNRLKTRADFKKMLAERMKREGVLLHEWRANRIAFIDRLKKLEKIKQQRDLTPSEKREYSRLKRIQSIAIRPMETYFQFLYGYDPETGRSFLEMPPKVKRVLNEYKRMRKAIDRGRA